ncbi:MAG: Cytochrome c-type biosis protein [Bacteroidota bacterium]|jgi:cytochrome c-type biogenesis protein CcmF
MIGQLGIHLLFGLAVAATIVYGLSLKQTSAGLEKIGRLLFRVLTGGLVASSIALIWLIVTHRFDYTYVWNYSSRELPLHLLVACFYSGQEGSILLWTLLVAAIGSVLQPYARRHGYESSVMVFYGLILSFLTLLMVAKNPFAYYHETFAANGLTAADVPENGRGLNPLLHNAWITIHPPILFTGFASMSVSFAFAMAGLLRREYHRWIDVALPWTLFATAILGFGIMLGGFWAYETLGWGGFWGWDPVENSSLIPWLVVVALVHTMLVQKRTRGLVKTNMILAVISFVMVLYSTFLTRSGVLGDTSVHSFVDPGKFAFWILLIFMVVFTILGTALVLVRRRDMNVRREEFGMRTREFMLSIGASLTMASAVFVTIGTSWPVIMEVLGLPKVAVAVDFYNQIHRYLVPAVLLVNGVSLVVLWRSTSRERVRRGILPASIVAVAGTVVLAVFGIRDIWPLALGFAAWFSLAINLREAWRLARSGPAMIGAYVSHTGIALLMFGVICTSSYSSTYHAVLVHGEPTTVGPYTLTYLGKEQVEKEFKDREKFRYYVRIERDGQRRVVAPVLYWSDFNQRQSAFLEPGIRWGLVNDLYVSPKATGRENVLRATTVMRGGTITAPVDSSMRLTLVRFTMPMEEGPSEDGRMQMAGIIRAERNGVTTEMRILTRISTTSAGPTFDPVWSQLPGSTYSIGLTQINRNNDDPTKSTGTLAFYDASKPMPTAREEFTVEFSDKPLISLVWFGVIAMVAGFGLSIGRSVSALKKKAPLDTGDQPPGSDVKPEIGESQSTT